MVVLGVIALVGGGLMWALTTCPLGRAIAIGTGQMAARREGAAAQD